MEIIMKYLSLFILFIILSCNSAIVQKENKLIGTYATTKNGQEEIKIYKDKDSFYLTLKSKGVWEKPATMYIADDSSLLKLFGKDYKNEVKCGLYREGIAVFEVNQESESVDKQPKYDSEYYLFFVLAGGNIYKLN